MRQHLLRKTWTFTLAVSSCLALTACSTGQSDTAWKLIQQQQEKQTLVRQHETDSARKNTPSEPDVLMAMIRETQEQQRYFASLAYIDAYTQQFGRNVNLDAARANALRMTGQAEQSRVAYQALLNTPQAAEGWHGLGLLAASNTDYSQAAAHLATAAALQPTNVQILNDLGYARLHTGDVSKARLPLGQAAELDPGNAKVLANLGLLLLLEGNSAQAQALMDQAQLPEDARQQVYRLASELRAGTLGTPTVRAQLPRDEYAGQSLYAPMTAPYGHTPLLR